MELVRCFQIRITGDYGDEGVENYHDRDEATARYWELHQEKLMHQEDNCFELELIEVLEQATVQPINSSDDIK